MKKIHVIEVWDFPQLKYGSFDNITHGILLCLETKLLENFKYYIANTG